MKRLRLALLSGGISNEREVSLSGGDEVYRALDKEKYRIVRYDPETDLARLVADASRIDVALINLHGAYGEDGTIQGMLDLIGIPYQGSGVLGSAITMNKLISKQRYQSAGLPVLPDIVIHQGDKVDPDDCIQRLGLPVVVKPVSGGSSIGITLVKSKDDLQGAIEDAFIHDHSVMIEAYVDGVELTGSVIGNDDLEALPIVEIIPDKRHDFFDYTAKYTAGETQDICPARIDDALTETAQTYAKIAHRTLFCDGYSRTDMMLQGRDIFIIETNTIPGMTELSLLPLAAGVAGMTFGQLLDRLIALGIERHRAGQR